MPGLFLPFWKAFSSFKAHLQSLTGWGTNTRKGLMHGSRGKESCQAGTLNHENKLHKSFSRHLFYVPAIHNLRVDVWVFDTIWQLPGKKKSCWFFSQGKKIQNKYTAVDEQKHFNQSHTSPSAQMQKRIHNRKINKPEFLRMVIINRK